MFFNDKSGNKYYTEKDRLYVDSRNMGCTKLIGQVSERVDDKSLTIVVNRLSDERTNVGYLIPAEPFIRGLFERIILIVDNEMAYIGEWEDLKTRVHGWVPKPGTWEDQIVLSEHAMKYLGNAKQPVQLI